MALQTVTFPVRPLVRTHLIINCVLLLITLVVVALRIVSRTVTRSLLGWDDYLILMAVPTAIGMLVIQGLYAPMGVGYPITETLPNITIILKLMMSYALIYTFSIALVKASVLCFYFRVFVNDHVRNAAKAVLALVVAWSIANLLLLFFMCRPFKSNYDLTVKGTCLDQPKVFMAIGAFNIISDILICALPIPTIWALKTRRMMKVGLTALFMITLLVSAVAVGRIVSLKHLVLADITGTMVWVDFLSTTEICLGILCVSLPMLGPLWKRHRNQRGASILHESPAESSQSKGIGSKFSGRSKHPGANTIALQSIDAYDEPDETKYSRRNNLETSSRDGSEASLNPALRSHSQPDVV